MAPPMFESDEPVAGWPTAMFTLMLGKGFRSCFKVGASAICGKG